MKNVMIITRNLKAGGAERVISLLSNNFCKNGLNCTILMLENEEIFYEINDQIELVPIEEKSRNKIIDKIKRYQTVRRYVKSEKPDIILTLPEEIGIFVLLSLVGIDIPIVVSERNNPWVMPWKKTTRILRKVIYPFAAGFIFQTEQASSFFPRYIREKSIVLPNPLELEKIPTPYNGERKKIIIGVGRLEKQKNFALLIEAFGKFYENHTDYSLKIYGEGSLHDELETLAGSLLPQYAYSFPGKSSNVLKEINDCSIFVLSSDYEGMPNALIEAMAMGVPVISTDCPSGGPARLINNGENGLLVPVRSISKLHEAMCLIAENEDYSRKLGINAAKIKQVFDSEVISRSWRDYLEKTYKK